MISMDKQVPKLYMKEYKEFKTLAWKLRSANNVATRIDFDGPVRNVLFRLIGRVHQFRMHPIFCSFYLDISDIFLLQLLNTLPT